MILSHGIWVQVPLGSPRGTMIQQTSTNRLVEVGVVIVLVLFIIMMTKNYFADQTKFDMFPALANRITVEENIKHPEINGSTVVIKDSKTSCEYLLYLGKEDKMVLMNNTCGKK